LQFTLGEEKIMRFILVVMIAVALTLTWQTTISAMPTGQCGDATVILSDGQQGKKGQEGAPQTSGGDEPECE
jgi:hypothetical protein